MTDAERIVEYERRRGIIQRLRELPGSRFLPKDGDDGVWLEGLYRNANGMAVAIVASINAIDWAAYIGGTEGMYTSEEGTVAWVARHGCKLDEADAVHFFAAWMERIELADLPYRA